MKRLCLAWCLCAAFLAAAGAAETLTPGAAPGAEGAAPVAVDYRAPNPAPPPAAVKGPASSWRPIPEALKWLAKTQEEDGSWDARKHEGTAEPEEVTALALMAFIENGNDCQAGKYQRNVRAAQNWLASRYATQSGGNGRERSTAPLALMALAEAWAMGEADELRPVVQRLADYAAQTQAVNGSWGEQPGTGPAAARVAPLATACWAMALKAAQNAGAKVSADCLQRAGAYFDQAAKEIRGIGGAAAQGGDTHHTELAAPGLLCLQALGRERDDPSVQAYAQALAQRPCPFEPEIGTGNGQTYRLGGWLQCLALLNHWFADRGDAYEALARETLAGLARLQEKEGENRGSWASGRGPDGPGDFAMRVGRVGVTAGASFVLGYIEGQGRWRRRFFLGRPR